MWSEFGTVPKAIAVSSARSPSLFSCRDIPACPVVLVQSVLDFVEAWFPENNTIFFASMLFLIFKFSNRKFIMLTKCQKKYKRPIYSRKRVSVRSTDYQEASYMCNRRKISKEHFLCQNRQRRHLYYK